MKSYRKKDHIALTLLKKICKLILCNDVFNQYTQIFMKIHFARKNRLINIYCTDQTQPYKK